MTAFLWSVLTLGVISVVAEIAGRRLRKRPYPVVPMDTILTASLGLWAAWLLAHG